MSEQLYLSADPAAKAPVTPFTKGMAASAKAAAKWSPVEVTMLHKAIERAAVELPEITTDDVWKRLPKGFPITKGIGTHMMSYKTKGVLLNTTRVRICDRAFANHAQRLTVWQSLVYRNQQ